MEQIGKELVLSEQNFTAVNIALTAAHVIVGDLTSLQRCRLFHDEYDKVTVIIAATGNGKKGKSITLIIRVYFKFEKDSLPTLIDVDVACGEERVFKFLIPPLKARADLDELDIKEIEEFEEYLRAMA